MDLLARIAPTACTRAAAIAGALALLGVDPSAACTVTMGGEAYPSIQAAVNAAPLVATIQVDGSTGVCNENLLIPNVTLRLILSGVNNATVTGVAGSPTVDVRVKGFMIQGFTVTGGSRGIQIQRNANAIIDSDLVTLTGGEGVVIDSMAFAVITSSAISQNPGTGIKVMELASARIGANTPEDGGAPASNSIATNGGDGISISGKSTAQIIGNFIGGNAGNGITVSTSSSASTAGNNISSNGLDGVAAEQRSHVSLGMFDSVASPDTDPDNNVRYGVSCTSGAVISGYLNSTQALSGTASQFGPATNAFDASCPKPATELTATAPPAIYSIGGVVSGLANGAQLVLLDNGADALTVSGNGGFTFHTRLVASAFYDVTVQTQPTGEACAVAHGTGIAGYTNVATVSVTCLPSGPVGTWTWAGGSNAANAPPIYGTQGVAASGNSPGARDSAATWTDAAGNFWLFGGTFANTVGPSLHNDLWKYDPVAGTWTWVNGPNTVNVKGTYGTQGVAAAANVPGARALAVSWIDTSGNLWLFGGYGVDFAGSTDSLSDLWKYEPATNLWTWVAGSELIDARGSYGTRGAASSTNLPGARYGGAAWRDPAGNFWMFGGTGYDHTSTSASFLGDLWEYSPATGLWVWQAGLNLVNAPGYYGTMGVASPLNAPGARNYATAWSDAAGNLWLFGGAGDGAGAGIGVGSLGYLNDLWEFNLSSGMWTWVGGSELAGSYGTDGGEGIASATNVPGARASAIGWTDAAGNLWLFGGYIAITSPSTAFLFRNDLWEYSPAANTWAWQNGSNTYNAAGVYGTEGVASGANTPGARGAGAAWIDPAGHFWMFGGFNLNLSGAVSTDFGDLWEFAP